jgi:hypothetical protein
MKKIAIIMKALSVLKVMYRGRGEAGIQSRRKEKSKPIKL